MNRLILIFFLLSPLSMQSHNGLCTIRKAGENVYVSSQIDDHHEINYWFKKCMANDLFTFYRVSVTSGTTGTTVVNEAYSDNIGPFEIRGGGWCGGNHLFTDSRDFLDKTLCRRTKHFLRHPLESTNNKVGSKKPDIQSSKRRTDRR